MQQCNNEFITQALHEAQGLAIWDASVLYASYMHDRIFLRFHQQVIRTFLDNNHNQATYGANAVLWHLISRHTLFLPILKCVT